MEPELAGTLSSALLSLRSSLTSAVISGFINDMGWLFFFFHTSKHCPKYNNEKESEKNKSLYTDNARGKEETTLVGAIYS